ncbi:MAG: hypothetical protein JRH19_27510 [Deltaproteobacteria bacterium]|nr:hypothetical protein [Deltaproteobacteria bacterium]
MSTTIVEPRSQRGPTLPEIAGIIAGIIALAIALAPTLANRDHGDAERSTLVGLAALEPDAEPAHAAPLVAEPSFYTNGDRLTPTKRCDTRAFDGSSSTPGAFCPLPQQEVEETRLVDLSFSWPPFRDANER